MKSIKSKILIQMIAVVSGMAVLLGVISTLMNYGGTLETLEGTTVSSADLAALTISHALEKYFTAINEAAQTDTFILEDAISPNVIRQSKSIAERNGFTLVGKADKVGNSSYAKNIDDQDYFVACRDTGKRFLSDPAVSGENKELTMVFAVPIMKEGGFNGIVYGEVDARFLSGITNSIKLGETGDAYVLNHGGIFIAHRDWDTVLARISTIEAAKSDPSLQALAELNTRMAQGERGFGVFRDRERDVTKILAYSPIPDSNGWSVGVTADRTEFLSGVINSIYATLLILLLILAVSVLLAFRLANSVSRPIRQCVGRLGQLEKGDLSSPVPTPGTRDETALLLETMRGMIEGLNGYIFDITLHLSEMAQGNLSTTVTMEYAGDFAKMKGAIQNINASLNDTFTRINLSADQVAAGSNQVSGGAQALSQGATQQASAVEELAATVSEISSHVRETAENAARAKTLTDETGGKVEQSNAQMQAMMAAIGEISENAAQIGKIIKTIEDIASQTNILALNAAVEAARAGVAGKGFTVVAEEVRRLANNSARASKNTSALIENAIHSVEKGTKIASGMAQSLEKVVQSTRDVVDIVDNIAHAANEQAVSIAQVTLGIDQISAVVQTNSATAEQSAAASEQLTSQAQMLRELVGKFKIKGQTDARRTARGGHRRG